MDWLTALMAGIGLPAVATVVGLAWRSRTGRLQVTQVTRSEGGSAGGDAQTDASALDLSPAALGASATLVQFST